MAVYCMLVTTPCNEGRKGDMFWTKNTPYDGVVWEVAQSTPEANFAELPRHTGYFLAGDIGPIRQRAPAHPLSSRT